MRVVSVLPSATEWVFALGHGQDLVGRSSECDYPAAARDLPVVMWPRTWDAEAPSADIDARVSATRSAGESLYVLDVPRLARLAPDLLLTQDLCGVCSVTGPEVTEACSRAGVRPTIVSLTPRTLGEVWSSAETVGAALKDPASGRTLARKLRARSGPPPSGGRPRVVVVEWLDPPILAGLWTPDIVHAAGGAPLGPRSGEPGVRTTWKSIAEELPDLVVLAPCSFSVARTRREAERAPVREGLELLGKPPLGVFLADEAYFSRPGPRLIAGIELVRHLMGGPPWHPPMPVLPWVSAEAGT